MSEAEHEITVNKTFKKISDHVKQHKIAYSIGTIIVISGVAYYVGTRVGPSRTLSPSITFGINSKLDQRVITLVDRSGPPSWKVFCVETGEELNSQRAMARAHGILEQELSMHLNGLLNEVNGKHYVRRGLAA